MRRTKSTSLALARRARNLWCLASLTNQVVGVTLSVAYSCLFFSRRRKCSPITPYRGTSLIRNCPPPQGHNRALGIVPR